jgi:hypothetical protein
MRFSKKRCPSQHAAKPFENALLYLGLLATSLASASEFQWSAEFGAQESVTIEDDDLSKNLLYLEPSMKYSFEWGSGGWKSASEAVSAPTLFEINAGVRAWFDTQSVRPEGGRGFELNADTQYYSYEADIRAGNIMMSREKFRVVAGFQEIPWGETFGLPILELVNPRDFRDPLLNDPSWMRLPVAAIQTQLFLGKLTLQGVLTPIPRHNRYPLPGSRFDPADSTAGLELRREVAYPNPAFGEFMEYGGRASYLFDGVDVAFMAYRHWNRQPVFQLVPTSLSTAELIPVELPMNTFGNSISYSTGPYVFRGDTAIGLNGPLQSDDIGAIEQGTKIQNIVGVDLTTEDGLNVGFQFQTEASLLAAGTRRFHWISHRISKRIWDGKLEPEAFIFAGAGNPDLWIQPKLTWYASDAWTVSFRLDLLGNSRIPGEGYLWTVKDQGRALLWVTFKL